MAIQRHLCEHAFVGEAGSPGALFWRAAGRDDVIAAESAAWEMQSKTGKPVPLDFAAPPSLTCTGRSGTAATS